MADAHWHPKREANRFEPPPWEREQFEALKKAREEPPVEAPQPPEPVTAEETAAAAAAAEAAIALTADLAAAREEAAACDAEPEAPVVERKAERAANPALPEAQVDAMLIQLGSEEPKVDEHLKAVGVFGSVVAMFFGVCMLFWGLYALLTARGQLAGIVGALIVLSFGGVFGGLGLWVGWRVTNRGE